ncbi:carbohydrate-binding module family 13 protein [Hydnomerulius pinastri MD-312]|nr:carbohydrate-binding module family 13 protein [Hydnomerulius pinastri MD-312]
MPVHRGTYTFVNRQSGTAMEMTSDHILVGMPPKDVDNQKWELHPLGAGHSIRNVKTGKYLSLKSISKEAPIVASDFPAAWSVKEVRVVEESAAFYEVNEVFNDAFSAVGRIRWPMTDFVFELSDFGSSSPKTKIHISEGSLPTDKQRCRYWKASRTRQDSFYRPSTSSPAATGQNRGSVVGLGGLFGFAEKWKSLIPGRAAATA